MIGPVKFTLDGVEVVANSGESIFDVARRKGTELPHMCSGLNEHYRADGNCRLCVVEIEGERVLAASCIRQPTDGMKVSTGSDRVSRARNTVMELLVADQPARQTSHDPHSRFWKLAESMAQTESRFPSRQGPVADSSHPAIAVNLDACIHCTNCVRACREQQVNDVIGFARRGSHAKVVFDFDDGMGASTCVGCGECVQACPTGALLPANGISKPIKETTVDSLCPYCGVGCQTRFHVSGDRIVKVEGRDGPANKGRLCVKGRFGMDYVNHAHRLTTPLIRKEGVAKSAAPDVDPANPLEHFREASWEEALELAASGLRDIRDADGGDALAGFGSAKGSNEEAYLFQKLVRTGFQTNNVDHCTRLCHASSVAALMETIGSGAVTAPFAEAANADVIIVIGSNTTNNHPVAATFIKNAAEAGADLIVLDPRGNGLSRYATHNLQFKPGADVALLNAIMHVIVTEGLYNVDYIKRMTEGFEELKTHLRDFSPAAMEPVTGIEAETIRSVARAYATAEKAMIFWGMGVSQHIHGTDNARCLISLALMCGQIGRKGTGLHPLRGQNNVQGASDVGLIPMLYPDYQPVTDDKVRAKFEAYWGKELDSKAGLTVVEITEAIYEDKIRGMYVMGENPAMSDPDANHARGALAKLDHLVVQDLFMTETAAYADVILPASAFPEKDGTFTNTDRRVQLGRAALPLPGDARQDWWIIQEIANRFYLEWEYTHPRDIFAELNGCMPSIRGITWERLEREGAVTYPCSDENKPGQEVIFGDRFPTKNGRGKFVPAKVIPPDEQPDQDYPYVLTTGRLLEHWHTGSMTRRATVLDALEPQAVAHLSPGDLRKLQLHAGGSIRVSTRRGEVELIARADPWVPAGMVFIPFCFSEAAANLLTNPALDPYGKIPEFKFCAARVEVGEQG
jgi:formate dehydrogenase major subunit